MSLLSMNTQALGSIHSCLPACKHSILEMCDVLIMEAHEIETQLTNRLQESNVCRCYADDCLRHIDLNKLRDLQ